MRMRAYTSSSTLVEIQCVPSRATSFQHPRREHSSLLTLSLHLLPPPSVHDQVISSSLLLLLLVIISLPPVVIADHQVPGLLRFQNYAGEEYMLGICAYIMCWYSVKMKPPLVGRDLAVPCGVGCLLIMLTRLTDTPFQIANGKISMSEKAGMTLAFVSPASPEFRSIPSFLYFARLRR